MRRVLIFSLLVAYSSGCATAYKEAMLPDGHTWLINVRCSDGPSCEVDAIKSRAMELCGHRPERIFGCGSAFSGYECFAACKSAPQKCEATPSPTALDSATGTSLKGEDENFKAPPSTKKSCSGPIPKKRSSDCSIKCVNGSWAAVCDRATEKPIQ